MDDQPLPQPLHYVLSSLFHVNCLTAKWKFDLSNILSRKPEWSEQFRQQFAKLILNQEMTPERYLQLTEHYFPNQQALNEYLRQRWDEYYAEALTPEVAAGKADKGRI